MRQIEKLAWSNLGYNFVIRNLNLMHYIRTFVDKVAKKSLYSHCKNLWEYFQAFIWKQS